MSRYSIVREVVYVQAECGSEEWCMSRYSIVRGVVYVQV